MRKYLVFVFSSVMVALMAPGLFAQTGVDFKSDILKKINGIRATHGAPPLTWSDSLAKAAQDKAELGAKNNEMAVVVDATKGSSGFLINKPWLSGSGKMPGGRVNLSGVYEAIDYMYNYKSIKYDFKNPVFPTDPHTLGFINLLWKGSTEMGFGIAVGAGARGNVYFYALFNAKANAAALAANVSAAGAAVAQVNEYESVIKEILKLTNQKRAIHGAPPLTINVKMSNYAQEWATLKAREKNLVHRVQTDYSENLCSWNQLAANIPVDQWYNEIKYYDFNNLLGNLDKAGHFTALIWQNSKEVGIGIAKSNDNIYYYVCNYSPRGNVRGIFNRNVIKPGTKAVTGVHDYTKGIAVKSCPESMTKTQVFGLKDCSSTNAVRAALDKSKKPYEFRDTSIPSNWDLQVKLLEEAQNEDTMNHPAPHVVIKQKLYMSSGRSILQVNPLLPLMP